MSDRQKYADVGAALRASIAAAIADKGINRRSKVLLAVLYFTASYSRTGDRVYLDQLAEVARLPGDRDGRELRRHLHALHQAGIIEWRGSRGGHAPSWVGLRGADRSRPLVNPVDVPPKQGGVDRPLPGFEREGGIPHPGRGGSVPPPEKFREESFSLSRPKDGPAFCTVCGREIDEGVYFGGQWYCEADAELAA